MRDGYISTKRTALTGSSCRFPTHHLGVLKLWYDTDRSRILQTLQISIWVDKSFEKAQLIPYQRYFEDEMPVQIGKNIAL